MRPRNPFRGDWAAFFAASFGGFFVLPGLVFLWLAANGALPYFWDQMVLHNGLLSSHYETGEKIARTAKTAYLTLGRTGILPLALIGCWAVFREVRKGDEGRLPYGAFLFLAWILEFAFVTAAGRGYGHYFLGVMPLTVLWMGEGLRALGASLEGARGGRRTWILVGTLLPILLAFSGFISGLRHKLSHLGEGQAPRLEAVGAIRDRTGKEDRVLVWGTEAGILLAADRDYPDRHIYPYPLLSDPMESPVHFDEFVANLEDAPPRVILDASNGNDVLPPLGPGYFQEWSTRSRKDTLENRTYVPPVGFPVFLAFVASRYRAVALPRGGRWILYVLRDPDP